jgi:hypothetical protein
MEIEVGDRYTAEETRSTLTDLVGSYLVTSHHGCSEEGARVPYLSVIFLMYLSPLANYCAGFIPYIPRVLEY